MPSVSQRRHFEPHGRLADNFYDNCGKTVVVTIAKISQIALGIAPSIQIHLHHSAMRTRPPALGLRPGAFCPGRPVCAPSTKIFGTAQSPCREKNLARWFLNSHVINLRNRRHDGVVHDLGAALTIRRKFLAATSSNGIATRGRSRFVLDSVRYRHMQRRRHVCARSSDQR